MPLSCGRQALQMFQAGTSFLHRVLDHFKDLSYWAFYFGRKCWYIYLGTSWACGYFTKGSSYVLPMNGQLHVVQEREAKVCSCEKRTPCGLNPGLVCFVHVSNSSEHFRVWVSDIKPTHSPSRLLALSLGIFFQVLRILWIKESVSWALDSILGSQGFVFSL